MPRERLAPGSEAGSWDGNRALVANLGLTGEAAVIELKQPDEQTLEVMLRDAAGATLATQRLRLGLVSRLVTLSRRDSGGALTPRSARPARSP